MIREKLTKAIAQAIDEAIKNGKLNITAPLPAVIVIERPRSPEHGDFACGVALKLAGQAKLPPFVIAETIAQHLSNFISGIANFEVVKPGYINFRLEEKVLGQVLQTIHKQGKDYGKSDLGKGKKVLVEYVSANPTGELHLGHARNAVFGSSLSNLLKFSGHNVEQEFYINDAGEQIVILGKSCWALYKKLHGQEVAYPEDGYPEDLLRDFVQAVINEHKDKFLKLSDEEGQKELGGLCKELILQSQKDLLEKMGIKFDCWFSEKTLHKKNEVEAAFDEFKKHGYIYESEGALWLKTKELGDERDRVLRKSTGAVTYLAADSAYHLDKFRRGYDRLINIWGADHHGQVPGLKGAVKALGQDPEKLDVILTQMLNLSRNGQIVRMSKRAGTVVLLSELVDEVGVDAVRYYLAESSPQNAISFDLELAKKTSRENPAFYIQYAHARCCAILRKALESSLNADTKQEEAAPVSQEQWQKFCQEYKESADTFTALFDQDPAIFAHQKALIVKLDLFPDEIEEAAKSCAPSQLARYAYDVANDLQKFYEVSRVITDNIAQTKARLGLIAATKQVLANVLSIIGVSAPEKM